MKEFIKEHGEKCRDVLTVLKKLYERDFKNTLEELKVLDEVTINNGAFFFLKDGTRVDNITYCVNSPSIDLLMMGYQAFKDEIRIYMQEHPNTKISMRCPLELEQDLDGKYSFYVRLGMYELKEINKNIGIDLLDSRY